MASQALQGGASAPPDPLAGFLAVLRRLPRRAVESIATVAIDELDRRDPDPDAERTGDEGEPDFRKVHKHGWRRPGPGCAISDEGGCEHDGREVDDGI